MRGTDLSWCKITCKPLSRLNSSKATFWAKDEFAWNNRIQKTRRIFFMLKFKGL
jgi:hypothetical protein